MVTEINSEYHKLKHNCYKNESFVKLKRILIFTIIIAMSNHLYCQSEQSAWKAQISLGINYPDIDGFVKGFEAKPVNFPTINLGVQHLFTRNLGAKLDFGYNRFSNADNTPEFKTNYTRVNMQLVYDATNMLRFLPVSLGVVGHIGPGLSFIKPLGNYGDNNHSFFNTIAGLELHYRIAETVSVYTDVSYVMNFSKNKTYNPISDGYGTFNNNLFTMSLGLSVSLSGCQYCD
jgi:hypothetical protein